MTMVMNPGMASERSSSGSSTIDENIIIPTIIITGAVADEGIARKIGLKNRAMTKQMAMVSEVRPLRPPCATPDELSMKVQAADVPNMLAATVPTESARNIPLMRSTLPSLSANPPLIHTPRAEPVRENRSMKRKDSTTISISTVRIWSHWNLNRMGDRD